MAYGYRAVWKILQTYYERFCMQNKDYTVRNIITRWAPPTENDTEAVAQGYKLAFPANREKLDKWLLDEDEYRYW